jgi:hypothetical protein
MQQFLLLMYQSVGLPRNEERWKLTEVKQPKEMNRLKARRIK